MTFKPAVWFPIAAVLSAVNVIAVWFAAVPGEPLHATIHAAFAVGFGVWAQRLRYRTDRRGLEPGLEDLEFQVNALRQELAEAQERLDFTERVLAQESQARRPDQER
jgi:hypothetical protein